MAFADIIRSRTWRANDVADLLDALQATAVGGGGTVTSSFIPNSNNAYDLGNSSNAFRTAYIGTSIVFTPTSGIICPNTSDAADNKAVFLCGGGAAANTRGARLEVYGNEHSTDPGRAVLSAGNISTCYVALVAPGASGNIFCSVAGADRWSINSVGTFLQDASGGGNIVLTKASTSVCQPVANAVSAAGSTISDATQLTAVHNRVTSVSSGQGVKLWDATTGTMITVSNLGSADLEVYPPDGSSGFNTAGAGVAITLATASNGIGLFIKTAANTWIAIVGAGPDT